MDSYLIKYLLYSVLFALLYWSFVRPYTNHHLSRAMLWVAIISPLVLPFIQPHISVASEDLPAISTIQLPEISVLQTQQAQVPVISYLFIFISGLFFIKFSISLISLLRKISLYKGEQLGGMKVLRHHNADTGSFFSYLFISENTQISEAILSHEQAHYRLRHSLDKLIMEVLLCVLWWNPIFWILKKELFAQLEFAADHQAKTNTANYAHHLLAAKFESKPQLLISTFFSHPLKQRILMLHKNKPMPLGNKLLLAGTLCACIITGIALQTQGMTSLRMLPKILPKVELQQDTARYNYVDQMPVYPGGNENLSKFLIANLKYPEAAKKANATGKVFLKFVVSKDGSLTDIKVIGAPKPDLGFSKEALRVVSLMPKWTPGRMKGKPVNVYYMLPMVFRLE